MMPFRLARRRNPAAVPGQPATRRARTAEKAEGYVLMKLAPESEPNGNDNSGFN